MLTKEEIELLVNHIIREKNKLCNEINCDECPFDCRCCDCSESYCGFG